MLHKVTAVALVVLVAGVVVGSEAAGFRRNKNPILPQHPYHRDRAPASPKGLQDSSKIIDTVVNVLPELTSVIKNVTKGASEKQINNLKKVTQYFGPTMHIFFELMSGKRLSWEERNMIDQVGGLSKIISSSLTQSNKETNIPLPDYTDLLEDPAATDAGVDITLAADEPRSDSLFIEVSQASDPLRDTIEPIEHVPASLTSSRIRTERPDDVGVRTSGIQTRPRMARPKKTTSIPHFNIKNPFGTFTEDEQTKEAEQRTLSPFKQPSWETQPFHCVAKPHAVSFTKDVQTETGKRTLIPRTQASPVSVRPSTTNRRYTPSQLLRRQLFGHIQSTTSSPPRNSDIRFPPLPVVRTRTGRRAVVRRRRLITTE
ncbi:uncharacterized protein LOC127006430 [Eriocheir sinensis]|uniref:uncharacterized protein LOC127006430 n=1 Tax=Eriocheir sinensis TaxID=95602 RepID=UPI0021C6E2B2|nr:uncharacterized protein LOC127006430 [Eriocheir sinensis]XP_050732348.1 uncharacterized protein LOC127006430 [Eriocheir sinensis]